MAEQYFAPNQQNVGWGLTLKMSGKAPAVAERIWRTYSDALAYINDFNGTATDGLCLSVLQDSVIKDVLYKAGVYYVKKAATALGANDGELVPTGMSETEIAELIESKTEENVADIKSISFSGNSLTVVYSHVGGDDEEISVEIPTADVTRNGLMSKEHVSALNNKIEGVMLNGVTLVNQDGVAQGEFHFDWDKDGENIVLDFAGTVIGSINVAEFVKDGILDSVELATADASGKAGTFMKFTFNTAAGKEPIYLNVEKLIDVYKLQKGTVTGGTFVTPTLTITGTGTSSDPWKVNLSIDDSKIGEQFDEFLDHVDSVSAKVNTNTSSIDELRNTVEGIVSVGGEANTIVKVTLNGAELTPDSNRVVNIPLATTAKDGAMSAADKAKLDGIEPMSEADILEAIQTAFES